jgi:hypothetical protein
VIGPTRAGTAGLLASALAVVAPVVAAAGLAAWWYGRGVGRERLDLRAADGVAAFGLVLLVLPGSLVHRGAPALGTLAQGAVMLAMAVLARSLARSGHVDHRAVATGAALALAAMALAAPADAALGSSGTGPIGGVLRGSDGRAALWFAHPNLLAAGVLLPLLAVTAWGSRAAVAGAVVASLVIVVASGSRSIVAVVLVLLVARWALSPAARGRVRAARGGVASLVALAALALVASFSTVLDRFDPRQLVDRAAPAANVLYASEDLTAGSWSHLGVEVRRVAPWRSLRGHRVWEIVKTEDAWWSRIQQGVSLPPGSAATFRVELQVPEVGAAPGIHAFSESETGGVELTLRRSAGAWAMVGSSGIEVRSWRVGEVAGWEEVTVELVNPTAYAVAFAFGLTPDQRDRAGGTLLVRRPQVVLGPPLPYQPTYPSSADGRTSLGAWSERRDLLGLAAQGFRARPWTGHGVGAFEAYAGEGRPAHAHNLVAQTLFESGIVGALGLVLFAGALVASAWRGSPAGAWIALVVVGANLVDLTFWSAALSYPFALLVGIAGASGGVGRAGPRA